MKPITDADISHLNERQAGQVELVLVGSHWFAMQFENIDSIGCQARTQFRIGADLVFDCEIDNVCDMPFGRLLNRHLERFSRDGDQVLVVHLSDDAEIRMWADDPAHECIVVELERSSDGISMMIF